MVRILAFDTATDACSVALLEANRAFLQQSNLPRHHAKCLLAMVDSLLREAGVDLAGVDLIACGIGPGSFTGIRIGIAAAQGLSFGQNLPVMGIPTLEVLAHGLWRQQKVERILVLVDAKMKQMFAAIYTVIKEGVLETLRRPQLIDHHLLKTWSSQADAIVSVGVDLPEGGKPIFPRWPQALDLAYLARARFKPEMNYSPEILAPLYVREVVATINKNRVY